VTGREAGLTGATVLPGDAGLNALVL
jgi:hypothetical protein